MATIELTGRARAIPARHGVPLILRDAWEAWVRRVAEQRERRAISRLSPRLMRDAGLDPEANHPSGWELLPANLLLKGFDD